MYAVNNNYESIIKPKTMVTRAKVHNFPKQGTSKRQTIMTAINRRWPWHLSRTMATQSGM